MQRVKFILSWLIVVGLSCGTSALFSWCVDRAFWWFMDWEVSWPLFVLPVVGLLEFGIYRLLHLRFGTSSAAVIRGIRDNRVPNVALAPAIFLGTTLTILFGGSVGKEAAVLQMGPAFSTVPEKLKLVDKGHAVFFAACAMAAGTGVLFGTPIGAFLLCSAVVCRRVNKPHEILCEFLAALIGALVGIACGVDLKSGLGIEPGGFLQDFAPVSFSMESLTLVLGLAIFACMLGVAFAETLLRGRSIINLLFSRKGNKHLKPAHVMVTLVVGGCIYAGLIWFLDDIYLFGTGTSMIQFSLYNDDYFGLNFAMKFVLTALLLICGFKGGEIMPTFAIAASFGSFYASHFGGDATFFASLAMVVMFATATGCPFASLAMGIEIFGFANAGWFVLVTLIPVFLTRKVGLYGQRRIFGIYDKADE